jgi:hypothetical protein
MPQWVSSCPFCDAELVHSEITKNITLTDLCFPRKPDFLREGLLSWTVQPARKSHATSGNNSLTVRARVLLVSPVPRPHKRSSPEESANRENVGVVSSGKSLAGIEG